MEEKMDSDRSYSGDSSSSSESSSGSSEGDDDAMEPVRFMGETIEVPQELCEDYSLFKEFFSMKTWESLEDKHKEQLKQFLPKFTENAEEETEKTIRMLFNYEPFHFTSPLNDFYNHLRQGNYRPDIAKMRKFLKRARSKQQKHKTKSYYAKLLPEVLISRERVLAAAKSAPPGPAPRIPTLPPKPSSKNNYKPVYLRAKQRYFEELGAIKNEVGGDDTEDENYPEGPPEPSFKKRKHLLSSNGDSNISGTLGSSDQSSPTSVQCLKNVLAAHRARRQYRENHPELNTTGITLDDIKQRVAIVNGAKKLMFGGQKSASPIHKLKRPKKEPHTKQPRQVEAKVAKKIKEEVDTVETKPLLPNIKIKQEQEESDSESSSFIDPVTSPKPAKRLSETVEVKQEVIDKYPNAASTSYESKLETVIKQEPPDPALNRNHQPVPIKLEDLDGIDMMALPIEIADECGEVIQVEASSDVQEGSSVDIDESLTETTHANFLSLVRALFPARAAHRASKQQLHARCAAVLKSPIAPLNTWYNLSDDWCGELDSALDFLAGERGTHPEDFVPYLQYMPETQIYQWIGAGRDCDAILGRLCERWLRATSPQPPSKEPPPPKYPTSWTVRPPTVADIAEFRAQEKRRFSSAAKPFTYAQHGYKSVVGPCGRGWGGAAGGGGAALLAADRPRHATFAALVRDALARLPNGEGTRHDVLTLLKMSQYIAQCSDQALLGAVSSALERFHTAKREPVVKYDQRTAIWTYLFRNRSEEDWIKTSGSRGRATKTIAAVAASLGPPSPPPPPTPPPPAVPPPPKGKEHVAPPHAMELEVASVEEVIEASDSDVDVDDSSVPSSMQQLSSAQLLMQATQSLQKTQPTPTPPKPKPKTVPTPQPKKAPQKQNALSKPTKQGALMTQSVKQANLLAQSVKQVSIAQQKANIVQVVKNSVAKQTMLIQPQKTAPNAPKTQTKQQPKIVTAKVNVKQPLASPKAVNSPKPVPVMQPPASPKPPPSPKQPPPSPKQVPQPAVSPKQPPSPKPTPVIKPIVSIPIQATKTETVLTVPTAVPLISQANVSIVKSLPTIVATPQKSPLIKQRSTLKADNLPTNVVTTSATLQHPVTSHTIIQPVNPAITQNQPKVVPGTRSLLIRSPSVQTTVTPVLSTPVTQSTTGARRSVVRVLSPANSSSGKSLISPRALLQDTPTSKKRVTATSTPSVTTVAQSTPISTVVVSSTPVVVTTAAPTATRTVQLAGGRTVQLATNQTVHLPSGQAVQLSSGHTLLSSLQLSTHSVRLPSGQTVQLATPQAIQALKTSSTVKTPRPQITKTQPVSTVQLAGQTVQIAGQTVQLAGQSVQLTGHTVKLPSGQSVQVASQSVQLPSGQTVQLASGNVQTVQIAGSNVQLTGQSVQIPNAQSVLGPQNVQLSGQTVQLPSGQTVQLPSGQTIQLPSGQTVQLPGGQTLQLPGGQTVQLPSGQTVQLPSGQTVQLPSGQTVQLPSGQTVQLSSGQTLQLASGQTVQLANQAGKSISHVIRSQAQVDKPATTQPIVAKLLTNAQGQMVSLEGVGRTLVGAGRGRAAVRVVAPPAARLARPRLLAASKPLHNIILQQSDGSPVRVTAVGGASTSQTLVISNIDRDCSSTSRSIQLLEEEEAVAKRQPPLNKHFQKRAQTVTTPTTSTPVLKIQQVNQLQQVKLPQGIKFQQAVSSANVTNTSGVRSVVMDGQQLKLVGGRHVLARILRPTHPPPQ